MQLSLVIPAYDEEERISSTLDKVEDFLEKERFDYEILVVDDGSSDRTGELVERFWKKNKRIRLLRNPGNRGKGYSVKHGFQEASKEWVLFSDADLSTPIQELRKFRKYIKNHDVIFGSRSMKQSRIVIKQPWYRRIPGKIFPFLVRMLVLRGIKDTQCGFKMFRKSCVDEILDRQTIDGWAFDVELLFIARKRGLRLKEVPVVWKNDLRSKISPIKSSVSMFLELMKIRLNDLRGRYGQSTGK